MLRLNSIVSMRHKSLVQKRKLVYISLNSIVSVINSEFHMWACDRLLVLQILLAVYLICFKMIALVLKTDLCGFTGNVIPQTLGQFTKSRIFTLVPNDITTNYHPFNHLPSTPLSFTSRQPHYMFSTA